MAYNCTLRHIMKNSADYGVATNEHADARDAALVIHDSLESVSQMEDRNSAWVQKVTAIIRDSLRADIRVAVLQRIANTCTDTVVVEEGAPSAVTLENTNDASSSNPLRIVLGAQCSLEAMHKVAQDLSLSIMAKKLQEAPADSVEYIYVVRSLAIFLLSMDARYADACALLMQRADDLAGSVTLRPDWQSATLTEKIEMLKSLDLFSVHYKDALEDIIPRMTWRTVAQALREKTDTDIHQQNKIEVLKAIYRLSNAEARSEFAANLAAILLEPERSLVTALVTKGWQHLAGASQISDREWYRRLELFREKECQTLRENGQESSDTYAKTEICRINAQLEGMNASAETRTLRDAIQCRKYRKELMKLRTEQSGSAIAAKELEIIARVVGAVSRYSVRVGTKGEEYDDYHRGFPRHIRQEQTSSCFGGPWLVSSLLLDCGIDYKCLFYCDVHRTSSGTIGGHGSLLVGTAMKGLVLIDTGYNITSQTVRLGWCEDETKEAMQALLSQQSSETVKIAWRREMDKETGMHSHLHCMPLNKGITSVYLFNLGVSFVQEKKWAEARYVFNLSLSYNSSSPDVLYYRGLCSFHEGDLDSAKSYFESALKECDVHLLSHFSLGEIALRQNQYVEAKNRFTTVAQCTDTLWGDAQFRVQAEIYSRYSPAELACIWQKVSGLRVENS